MRSMPEVSRPRRRFRGGGRRSAPGRLGDAPASPNRAAGAPPDCALGGKSSPGIRTSSFAARGDAHPPNGRQTHVPGAFTSRQAAWVVRTIRRSANPRPAAGSSAAGWGCETAGRSSALIKWASRAYNMGRWRGRGPRGNAASIRMNSSSVSRSGPALALSAACSGLDALGIVKVDGLRARNRSAT